MDILLIPLYKVLFGVALGFGSVSTLFGNALSSEFSVFLFVEKHFIILEVLCLFLIVFDESAAERVPVHVGPLGLRLLDVAFQ